LALALERRGHLLHTDRAPDFKGAELPGETPAAGAVNVHYGVRTFRDAPRGVEAIFAEAGPKEAIGFVAAFAFEYRPHERAEACARILDGFATFDRAELRFLARAIFERLPIEREDFGFPAFLHALIKAAACFVAEPAALHHFLDECGNMPHFARFIVGNVFVNIADDVDQHVESNDVGGAERGGFRLADSRTGTSVHFFDGHVERLHLAQDIEHRVGANAVGDKVGRVFGDDNALAQAEVANFIQRA